MELKAAFYKFVAKELSVAYETAFLTDGKVHKTDFINYLDSLLHNLKIKFIQNFNLNAFEVSYEDLLEDGDPELLISRLDTQEIYYALVSKGFFRNIDMFVYPSELTKFRALTSKFNKYSSKFSKYKGEGLVKTIYVLRETPVPGIDVYTLSQSVASSVKNVKILGKYEGTIEIDELITKINTNKVFPVCLMCEGYIASLTDHNILKYNNVCPECGVILENIPLVKPSDRKSFLRSFLTQSTGLFLQESDYLQDCLVNSWNY